MVPRIENIALFDMDGTLCDHDDALFKSLEKLRSPEEPVFHPPVRDDAPAHIKERAFLIRDCKDWWANLPRFQLGFDIWELAEKLGYRRVILTQGPKKNPSAWQGKKLWIDRELSPETDIIMTRDKSLTYGRILVDDYLPYVLGWLKHRPRGLVIMPASKENARYKSCHNPQIIRYDGSNYLEVAQAMEKAKRR